MKLKPSKKRNKLVVLISKNGSRKLENLRYSRDFIAAKTLEIINLIGKVNFNLIEVQKYLF